MEGGSETQFVSLSTQLHYGSVCMYRRRESCLSFPDVPSEADILLLTGGNILLPFGCGECIEGWGRWALDL